MNGKALVWGLIWCSGGLIVAAGWLPQSSDWSLGPRIGIAGFLVMLGLTVATVGNVEWFLRRTTKAKDYESGCPVGARCACGTFNMRPRTTCKSCGADVDLSAETAQK